MEIRKYGGCGIVRLMTVLAATLVFAALAFTPAVYANDEDEPLPPTETTHMSESAVESADLNGEFDEETEYQTITDRETPLAAPLSGRVEQIWDFGVRREFDETLPKVLIAMLLFAGLFAVGATRNLMNRTRAHR